MSKIFQSSVIFSKEKYTTNFIFIHTTLIIHEQNTKPTGMKTAAYLHCLREKLKVFLAID